jgi:activator of HSP90 ATPase
MNESTNPAAVAHAQTRRQLITRAAIAFSTLATASTVWAEAQQPAMQEIPATAANRTRTTLHYQADLKASPQRVYEILLDSKLFAAVTGLPAEIDPKAGGTFSLFSGQIEGRNIELVPNQRIVQAWRPTHWDPGVYSIVRFELKPRGSESTLQLDHTGFPEGLADHLDEGWRMHYLATLQKYLA